MNFKQTKLNDVYLITPSIFSDNRGCFHEVFNVIDMEKFLDIRLSFVQQNQSTSKKNVFRGLHYQSNPFAQDKLVRVLSGRIVDIVVDLRKSSSTFKKWIQVPLDSICNQLLWIPKGFAHGFHSLEDNTIVSYHVTNFYSKENENTVIYNDKELSIPWNEDLILSEKDLKGKQLSDLELFE